MLMIRMQRIGRKNDPSFRIVVTEKERGPKSGNFIEKIGWYDAAKGTRSLDKERVLYWMERGAQLSGTVHNFLVDEKVLHEKKINVLPKKSIIKKEGEVAPAQAPEENAITVEKEKKEEAPAEQAA